MNENTETPTPATAEPKRLVSPYPGAKYHDADSMRITIDVPKADVQTIRLVNLSRGFIYNSLQTFIKSLVNECDKRKWTINNADDLERYVLERCNVIGTDAGSRSDQNVGRPASGVRQDGASETNKRSVGQRKQTKASDSVVVAKVE